MAPICYCNIELYAAPTERYSESMCQIIEKYKQKLYIIRPVCLVVDAPVEQMPWTRKHPEAHLCNLRWCLHHNLTPRTKIEQSNNDVSRINVFRFVALLAINAPANGPRCQIVE